MVLIASESESLFESLQLRNIESISVTSGNQALAVLCTQNIDVFVCEMELPVRSGILTLEYLRTQTNFCNPILAVSSDRSTRLRNYLNLLNVHTCLIRPFEDTEFVRSVRELLPADSRIEESVRSGIHIFSSQSNSVA